MVQINLSLLFLLIAATIAPVVARPVGPKPLPAPPHPYSSNTRPLPPPKDQAALLDKQLLKFKDPKKHDHVPPNPSSFPPLPNHPPLPNPHPHYSPPDLLPHLNLPNPHPRPQKPHPQTNINTAPPGPPPPPPTIKVTPPDNLKPLPNPWSPQGPHPQTNINTAPPPPPLPPTIKVTPPHWQANEPSEYRNLKDHQERFDPDALNAHNNL